jgi:hypothetical protein
MRRGNAVAVALSLAVAGDAQAMMMTRIDGSQLVPFAAAFLTLLAVPWIAGGVTARQRKEWLWGPAGLVVTVLVGLALASEQLGLAVVVIAAGAIGFVLIAPSWTRALGALALWSGVTFFALFLFLAVVAGIRS